MSTKHLLSRRTLLKGLGTSLALPLFDAMLPNTLLAEQQTGVRMNRLAFLFVPNGIHMQDWTPKEVGDNWQLPSILQSLSPVKEHLLVYSGLAQDKARPNGDGPGDHARSASAFLTGAQPRKTPGADIKVGKSVDQVAAEKLGWATRLPSLEIGCEQGAQAGNCDSGYSCAYSSNISWKTETTPLAKEINPRLVFERLFAVSNDPQETAQARARRKKTSKSILDFVLDDANRLRGKLGTTDQRKMDEYLTSVREIEARIQRVEQGTPKEIPNYEKPAGIPPDYQEHLRLMCDLLVLAFQADVTRVATFMFANEGSNRNYPNLNIQEGHHSLSHHGGDAKKHDQLRTINTFHVQQLAYLLTKMKSIPEGAGNLLDNSMIVYGSGIGDGDRHNHDNLPILVAGKGAGTIRTGRHLKYDKETPLNNLYLSLLDRMEVKTDKLGDSTGRVTDLS